MKIFVKLVGILAATLMFNFSANAQLPAEVQADLLQEKIISSLQSKDYSAAKSQITEYKTLGVAVPPSILLIEAKIAIQDSSFLKAQRSLEEYFNAGGREHKSYQEALILVKWHGIWN